MTKIYRNIDFATGSRAGLTVETAERFDTIKSEAEAIRGLISDLDALKHLYQSTAEQAEATAIIADRMADPGLKQSLARMAEGYARDAIFYRNMIDRAETILTIGGVA